MALTLVDNGTATLASGANLIKFVSAPGVYVALFDYINLDGCVVRPSWQPQNQASNNPVAVIGPDYTVDTVTSADPRNGQFYGPAPVLVAAALNLYLVSGTPTGDLIWELYHL